MASNVQKARDERIQSYKTLADQAGVSLDEFLKAFNSNMQFAVGDGQYENKTLGLRMPASTAEQIRQDAVSYSQDADAAKASQPNAADSFVTKALGDLQSAQDKANAANEKRYSEGLGVYDKAFGLAGETGGSTLSPYNGTGQMFSGYGGGQPIGLYGGAPNVREVAARDVSTPQLYRSRMDQINDAETQDRARMQQNLINSGLFGSSQNANLDRAVVADKNRALNQVTDAQARAQLDTETANANRQMQAGLANQGRDVNVENLNQGIYRMNVGTQQANNDEAYRAYQTGQQAISNNNLENRYGFEANRQGEMYGQSQARDAAQRQAGILQNRAGFIERRTDQGPDIGLYSNLIRAGVAGMNTQQPNQILYGRGVGGGGGQPSSRYKSSGFGYSNDVVNKVGGGTPYQPYNPYAPAKQPAQPSYMDNYRRMFAATPGVYDQMRDPANSGYRYRPASDSID